MAPLKYQHQYERKLPHYQPPGATFFITFRLHDSLPESRFDRPEIDQVNEAVLFEEDLSFQNLDSALDNQLMGTLRLDEPQVAEVIQSSLHYLDQKSYDLLAYCIMPNHVHLVIVPLEERAGVYYSLSEMMHSLKRFSARKANEILGRSGKFWQHESYDHVVRNESELERVIAYTLNNPVNARLINDWEQWKWLYCKYDEIRFNK